MRHRKRFIVFKTLSDFLITLLKKIELSFIVEVTLLQFKTKNI